MNRIILLGRLTKDPEVRYTPNGRVVCGFKLAVDRPFVNPDGEKEVDFVPVVIWGKQAETCGNGLQKGHRALVEGRLQIRSYDAKDGTKRYVTEVVADRFEFVERKTKTQGENTPPEAPGTPQESSFEGMGSPVPFNEEIPF